MSCRCTFPRRHLRCLSLSGPLKSSLPLKFGLGIPLAEIRSCQRRAHPDDVRDVQVGRRSGRLGLRLRQCRLRQDLCAGPARDQPAAARRRSGENPLHHLHQDGRRQHGERGVRRAGGLDRARRRRARRGDRALDRRQARRRAARAGAPAVRLRAGDAGRPEGADHPRLLHAAAAPVSVRGQCRRPLHRAGRGRDHAAARPADARTCCWKPPPSQTARSAARWTPRSWSPPTRPSRTWSSDAIRERDAITAWTERAGSVDGRWRNCRRRSASTEDTPNRSSRNLFAFADPAAEWPALIEILDSGSASDQKHIATLEAARAAAGRERIDNYLIVFCTAELEPRKCIVTKIADKHPDWLARLVSEQERASASCSSANARWPRASVPARWSPSRRK